MKDNTSTIYPAAVRYLDLGFYTAVITQSAIVHYTNLGLCSKIVCSLCIYIHFTLSGYGL